MQQRPLWLEVAMIMGRLLALVLSGLLTSASAAAQQKARQDCTAKEPQRRIAGCTEFLNRGTRESTSNRAIAYNNRGNAYSSQGEYDRAIADYSEAIRLNPKNAAYSNRGIAYYNKGDYDRAIADYNEAIRLNPKNAAAFSNRAVAYSKKGEYDRAIADANEAIRLDPKYAVAFNNRSNAYSSKGEYDRAIADANEAIRLDPKYATAYSNRSIVYNNKGEYDRAIADANEAIRLNPKYAIAYSNRAVTHSNKGEYDRAIGDYDEAIRLDPQFATAYSNRGAAYNKKGEYDRAIADTNEAIRLDPRDAVAYSNRGKAYEMKGNFSQAVADYAAALTLNPQSTGTKAALTRVRTAIAARPNPGSTAQTDQRNTTKFAQANKATAEFLARAKGSHINGNAPRQSDPAVRALLDRIFDLGALGSNVLLLSEVPNALQLHRNASAVLLTYYLAATGKTEMSTSEDASTKEQVERNFATFAAELGRNLDFNLRVTAAIGDAIATSLPSAREEEKQHITELQQRLGQGLSGALLLSVTPRPFDRGFDAWRRERLAVLSEIASRAAKAILPAQGLALRLEARKRAQTFDDPGIKEELEKFANAIFDGAYHSTTVPAGAPANVTLPSNEKAAASAAAPTEVQRNTVRNLAALDVANRRCNEYSVNVPMTRAAAAMRQVDLQAEPFKSVFAKALLDHEAAFDRTGASVSCATYFKQFGPFLKRVDSTSQAPGAPPHAPQPASVPSEVITLGAPAAVGAAPRY